MRPITSLWLGGLLALSLQAQNPAPAAVLNPASNIPTGHPNTGIAQGSIFVVYPAFAAGVRVGGRLGPDTLAQAPSLPLPVTLAGTSIKVTVSGTTVDCFMVYTLASQVAAVLPSNTPVGNGTLALTYNGATGTVPIRVSQSKFGISTVNQSGSGPGVITFPDYQLVSSTKSAKPGDVLVAWGTGLGPANNDSGIATNGDLGTNLLVWVGGVQAAVEYRGRSSSPGLDQINFIVPAGVAPGCAVSLVMQTGGPNSPNLSNTVTLPVMPNGGTCSDSALTGIPDSVLNPLLAKSSVKLAATELWTENRLNNGTPAFEAQINAFFLNFTQQQLASQLSGLLGTPEISAGSCSVTMRVGFTSGGGDDGGGPDATGLDAGATITMAPPSGAAYSLPGAGGFKGAYSASPTSTWPAGTWRQSNGTGGADVPPYSIDILVPQPVIWSNQTASIDRAQPLNIKWTGGHPDGVVTVSGGNGFGSSQANSGNVTFTCVARASAGEMSIPAQVLMNVPASSFAGFLQISGESRSTHAFSGFDLGLVLYENSRQYAPIWR